MPIKSACAVAGIGVSTLADWRRASPEIEARIGAAREALRQKAFQAIGKAIGDGDWRAAVEALKLAFPEYRNSAKVEVKASVQVEPPIVTEEQRQRLIKLLEDQRRSAAIQAPKELPGGQEHSQSQLIQNPVRIPGRPFIEVDAWCLPTPQPEADQDPGGLAEGWGLDHPELS